MQLKNQASIDPQKLSCFVLTGVCLKNILIFMDFLWLSYDLPSDPIFHTFQTWGFEHYLQRPDSAVQPNPAVIVGII